MRVQIFLKIWVKVGSTTQSQLSQILTRYFQVECDASYLAIREMLIQESQTIAFFNEKLDYANKMYSAYDQEYYAIVETVNKWKHYLFPKYFFFVHLPLRSEIFEYLGKVEALTNEIGKISVEFHQFLENQEILVCLS